MRHPIFAILLLAGACAQGAEPALDPVAAEGEPAPDPVLMDDSTGSEQLFAPAVAAVDEPVHDEHDDDYLDPLPASAEPALRFTTTSLAPWSSDAGRARQTNLLAVQPTSPVTKDAAPCVVPQYMTGTSEGTFDGVPVFKTPNRAFASAEDAGAFLASVRAKIPFYLPFSHPDVVLGQGWIYESGGSHRGLDYSRKDVPSGEDSTFLVRAMAPGRVMMVTYRPGGGNGVFIEHTFPDGTKAISVHYHLRNGRDHDVAQARALTCAADDSRCLRYQKFATDYATHQSWGTNAHKLLVKIGDQVQAGQALGWSGNTGVGGAASGLNDDGSPKSWKGNVHLHMYFAVESPSKDAFVYVDPYQVYEQRSTGCYAVDAETAFPRLIAPFFSNFHGLPLDVLARHFGYFADMGWSLRTLSVHDGDGLRASGSFQPGIAGAWRARINLDAAQFQAWSNTYYGEGLIARETSVTTGADGKPRFSAVWRPIASGEHVQHRGQLTDAAWSSLWSSLVGNGYRVADYFGYRSGGTDYHLALYTDKDARPFYFFRDRDATNLKEKIDWGFDNGYAPVLLHATERGGDVRFTTALRPVAGCWRWYVGLTSAEYQAKAAAFLPKGYRIEKLQGYANSSRYAAIFHIPSGQAPAVCP